MRFKIANNDFSKLITGIDVIRINNGEDLQDALESAYSNEGINNTTFVDQIKEQINIITGKRKNQMARK